MSDFVSTVSIKSIVLFIKPPWNYPKSVTLLQQKAVNKQIFNDYHAACMNRPIVSTEINRNKWCFNCGLHNHEKSPFGTGNKKDGYRQQNVRQRQKLISIIDYDVCMTFY